ncbi:MAG TPA: aminotransferase class I/II-fold pyridoxal phosphate-dependent enzyme [Ignavibacteria bacterium]|nr:methionine gamma-lyase [Bacteroidota bacterium]HRE12438.1 aminotransferase class I/II-fold pyridoxal phosphate-dependent enzyme [Ignavibacteria bacterium]HRF66867.1 aminotransferase class I/II-fold pyridoxal phosphate-dependent enzyme [Ignavibacteria bacterium]HRJ03765.1 aminotransferase class I/II-fold pyridoxal phosphate-dependent enzyme [Ignavibacteria bacterium]HRJ85916.1 aminotransferase class I/II-fold pyridoxal phosphate-dependent enzyme [Ignavibacteria bacterium]
MDTTNTRFNTKLIHGGGYKDKYGSVNVPIFQSSTFEFESAEEGARCFLGESDGYIYTRLGNPTINALEKMVAELEGGFGGIGTSSGMGAINTVYMALLSKGDHMVSSDAVYGPSRVIMEDHYSRYGVESTYVNTSDINNIKKAVKPNTKVLYIETPANPTVEITDIKACAEIAKEHGLILVVDNTFSSPYLQRPLELGADVVLHSMTKFINGHADIVGGMVVAKSREMYKKLRSMMTALGCNLDPHQSYLVIRGLKTLAIRIDRAQQNAQKVAEYLEKHPKVEWVRYPGLPSHPQYELAKKQMDGPGALISFGLKGGFEAGKTMMNNVKISILAVSLGGVESLIEHPASMTHSKVSKEDKQKAGISDGLVRYSAGIEDINDLLWDLEQALAKVK